MTKEVLEFYVTEANRLAKEIKEERSKVIDEAINKIVDLNVKSKCKCNSYDDTYAVEKGYKTAQNDIINILKELKK